MALLRLRREQKVWPILQHRPDPRTRSYLIHRFGPLDADPHQVLTQLDTQGEVSIRRALILILGEFSETTVVAGGTRAVGASVFSISTPTIPIPAFTGRSPGR